VIPLHKKGSKLDASNCSEISKLSAILKLFENVITPNLQHLCRSYISPCQHGFMKRGSITTNLWEIIFKHMSSTLTLVKHLTSSRET